MFGYYLYRDKRPDKAYSHLKKAIALRPTPTDLVNIAYYQFTETYPNRDSADYYYQRAIKLSQTNEFKNDVLQYAILLLSYGDFLVVNKDYLNGIDSLKKALSVINTTGNLSIKRVIHLDLATGYGGYGDLQNKRHHQDQVALLEKEIFKERDDAVNQSLSHLTNQYERVSERSERVRNRITLVACIAVGILIFLFYYIRKIRSVNRRKRTQLTKKEEVVKDLQKKVDQAFEEVFQLARQNSPNFYIRFQQCYPEFEGQLLRRCPELKNSELVLLGYVYLNFQSKEIADYTFKSTKTIQNRKHLLRKKLQRQALLRSNLGRRIHQIFRRSTTGRMLIALTTVSNFKPNTLLINTIMKNKINLACLIFFVSMTLLGCSKDDVLNLGNGEKVILHVNASIMEDISNSMSSLNTSDNHRAYHNTDLTKNDIIKGDRFDAMVTMVYPDGSKTSPNLQASVNPKPSNMNAATTTTTKLSDDIKYVLMIFEDNDGSRGAQIGHNYEFTVGQTSPTIIVDGGKVYHWISFSTNETTLPTLSGNTIAASDAMNKDILYATGSLTTTDGDLLQM